MQVFDSFGWICVALGLDLRWTGFVYEWTRWIFMCSESSIVTSCFPVFVDLDLHSLFPRIGPLRKERTLIQSFRLQPAMRPTSSHHPHPSSSAHSHPSSSFQTHPSSNSPAMRQTNAQPHSSSSHPHSQQHPRSPTDEVRTFLNLTAVVH